MTELRTTATLLDALRRATRRALTEDELRKQRVSFIMGSINDSTSVARTRVEEILDVQEGRKAS